MNEHDKDIYDSGIFCGTLDERQRIIKLLEEQCKKELWSEQGAINRAIELIKGEK
jgi:hypothetical protein